MKKDSRSSFTISKKEWDFFCRIVEMANLRRDSFISKSLAEEMEEIKHLRTNTDEESKLIYRDFKIRNPDRIKMNILLPRQRVKSLNELCTKKNIRRSCFFNRFIEFLNVRCSFSLLTLASPRRTLNEPQFQWLKRMSVSSPAMMNYVQYLEENMETGEAQYFPFEGDPYWDDFYSCVLNLASDDPRRFPEEELSSVIDRMLNGDMEGNNDAP